MVVLPFFLPNKAAHADFGLSLLVDGLSGISSPAAEMCICPQFWGEETSSSSIGISVVVGTNGSMM